jgi:hypothetical protein
MFAAHKAAGCMTSIYRQIGIGCERLFRQIIFDTTGYEDYATTQWSYKTKTQAGKEKELALDGRLEIAYIKNNDVKKRVKKWISKSCEQLGIDDKGFKGAVFEVRQGYKSKDSKRQNGDIDNATVAYAYHYIPVFSIFSSQIDNDIVLRYKNSRCCVLVGNMNKKSLRFLVLILQGNPRLRFGGVLQDELTIYPRKGWQITRTIIQRP